jgi:hypothetical protein
LLISEIVTIVDGNIELKIDSNIGSVNGKEFKLEAPVTIYNNKTYIPLDFIKQVFNKKVILLPEDSIVLTRDEDEYATIKETLDNVNKAISKIEKLKIFVNMKADTDQMSAAPIFVDLDMNASIDSKNETGYVISTTSIYDTLIKNEVYFKNGVAYIRYQESKADNRKEKWETVSGEESIFNNIAEKFMRMVQLEIDENMYGLFTIDEEKSNSSILVMKNNLSCKSLIKKLINNQLILGTDSQIGEQDILGIEDIYVEYRISKKTYNPESMLIKLKIAPGVPDQSKNITEDVNITIKFRNINGKFRVTKPE